MPAPRDFAALVEIERHDPALPERIVGPEHKARLRDGFELTDTRMNPREAAWEDAYCITCHDRDKDSCNKGLRGKDGVGLQTNALGNKLTGCPLDERVGELIVLAREGDPVGAVALCSIDNPLLPGTGHRICNDCMKACIYQKQDPVNIPQIETRVLVDVLAMPWGFEIWSLLTRWNPLNVRRPYALPYNGKKVLVVGLGPAGYTLAHHLVNEGVGVVAIDGLKIEPLPEPALREPIRDRATWHESLRDRVLLGFGGVSEYGITVRWDKNFLFDLYLNLARRPLCEIIGGVRFGGTMTIDDAWAAGFDHVAIAAGAGKPTIVPMKNNLIRGIRQASDFLMALQLTGAYKPSSLSNLQVELPAIVVGGGLTAIDAATELLAYYPIQCERLLERYEQYGEGLLVDAEEKEKLDRFLAHGRAVRDERARANAEGRAPNFVDLAKSWGGVSIVYRRTLRDSPAYRLNHEEIEKSLEEGISIVECMSPVEAVPDERGQVRAMRFERMRDTGGKLKGTGEIVELPARTVCIAAGTTPNTMVEREAPGQIEIDPKTNAFVTYRAVRDATGAVTLEKSPDGFFTSYQKGEKLVSYYGDNHPTYAGSVVRAMASARDGFVRVVELLRPRGEKPVDGWKTFVTRLADDLAPRVHSVSRLTPTITEVVLRAPAQARRFKPGQFFRLQNYEAHAPRARGLRLTMEGVALTGASVDKAQGLLSLILLEVGASSRMASFLKPGEPVVVMGPTGAPTEIEPRENVILCGGGLGNAVLFSIGKAMRDAGARVLYFAGYRRAIDVFKRDEVEAATDEIIWSVDAAPTIEPRRPQDHTFEGNIVQAMVAYAKGELGTPLFPLTETNRIIAIGSDRMMAAVQAARHGVLLPYLSKSHHAIASINSPMQCMMKEVCAQCLQRHVDPATGEEKFIFSCFNQDQPMDHVDFKHLASRLRQNTVLEKIANRTLEALLASGDIAHV
ncbi:MAG: FAD-dependent oxidoreductase [Deltaproteobacteria bacterium]|nr:FAD-dependent oxidoreductase [Deltaproteobacteria bacterium]